jgi:hypothetical protein
MKKYYSVGSIAALAMAASIATAASAQRYNDYEYENEHNSLTLICWGEGRKPGTSVSTGYSWDHHRHKFVPQTYLNNTTREFDSEVQVELHDDWGRIHLTGKLVPPIHSGGSNGWWELENVHVGPDTGSTVSTGRGSKSTVAPAGSRSTVSRSSAANATRALGDSAGTASDRHASLLAAPRCAF